MGFRFALANYGDVIDHRPGENPDWKNHSWVNFALTNQLQKGSCLMAFFVIPLPWMKLSHNNIQGKLQCPKCCSKIGACNWSLCCKCPCNASFSPSFYLIASKVDVVK